MSRSGPLLLCALLATLAPDRAQAQATAGVSMFESCKTGDALYRELEYDRARPDRITLRGSVQLACDDTRLFADEVIRDGSLIIATGHVVFSQKDLYVSAERAEIDRQTQLGVFINAGGVAQLTDRPVERSMFGTLEPQVTFYGDRIEKTGERTYRITHGGFSTCAQPTPRWEIVGSAASVTLDERIVLRNAVLKVKNVPLFYVPLVYYPLGEDDRSTGFLLPSYSTSSFQGTGLSNAFFLVLGRSQDAMFKHTWFSKGGQVMSAAYRFVSAPGSNGNAEFKTINEPAETGADGAIGQPGRQSFTFSGSVNQGLPRGFRLLGNANYFTDLRAEQIYQQNVFRATQRERYYSASLSGTLRRVRISANGEQRDVYFGFDRAARQGSAPRVSLGLTDRPIGRSRVYVGVNTETAYLIRQDDISRPETNQSLLRFDASPVIRAPLSHLTWLSVSTAAYWRMTHWLESLDPVSGLQVPIRLTRNLLDLRARAVGPVFARVFQTPDSGYSERIKHLIEPEFSVHWLSPFEHLNQVVKHDNTDYQVGGTTALGYSLSNQILVRRRRASGQGDVRQVLTVSLSQTYYSNQLAATYDTSYQSAAAGRFSPLRLNAAATPADDVSANFQMEIDSEFRRPRSMTLTGSINRPSTQVTAGWSKRLVIPGLPGFEAANSTHFLNAAVGVRPLDGRVQGRYELHYDIRNQSMLQQRVMLSYNAQCCGVNVDYQTFSFAHLTNLPNQTDRRFGISFTLAGIGSFSNPLGSFGNNSGR
jgi:lipopolysaccharide assembly outer membrane protein LptD (OstA)